jgi:L-lactate dehydrogenase complex protein LldG
MSDRADQPAREAILARLRRTRREGDAPIDEEARRTFALTRLVAPKPNTVPLRADLPLEERVAVFTAQAEAVQSTVRRVPRLADVADAVLAFLRQYNLSMELVAASDPMLDPIDWNRTMLEVRRGRPQEQDTVGLTTAFAGIAETGTLMLVSRRATPTTLAFLPDNAIVVLPTRRVLRAYEDGLQLLRDELRNLPRSINFVTGPSRTGDIEQTILLGAHGPRRLLVLLVDGVPERKAA